MLKTRSSAEPKKYAMMEVRLAGGIYSEEPINLINAAKISCDVVLNADNPGLMGIFCERTLEKELTAVLTGRAVIKNRKYITDKQRKERLARIARRVDLPAGENNTWTWPVDYGFNVVDEILANQIIDYRTYWARMSRR